MLDDKYFGECKAVKERDFVCVWLRLLKLEIRWLGRKAL